MVKLLGSRGAVVRHRHRRLLNRHQHQIGPVTATVNHRLHGIGNKHQLTVNGNRRAEKNAGIRLNLRPVIGQDKVKRRLLPFGPYRFCDSTCAGASARDASDRVTVNTASGGNATRCRILMVPDTLGCCCEELSEAMP